MEIAAAAAAAFAAIKGAIATVAAIKVLGMTVATWAKVAMWASMGASMLMKPPGLPSVGVQVNLQPAGANAPLPIAIGRTGIQGLISYREAYPDAVHNTSKNNKLAFETIVSVGPVKSISNYTLTGHQIYWDRDPTRLGSSTGVSICRGVQGFDAKSSVWKDGVRAAFILGAHNDNRTLRDITGDTWLPNVNASHKMSGLARIVQVFELDGSKNLRFPMGFPDQPQATVEGIFAWDPRQDSTWPGGMGSQRLDQPLTWGWSENPYIIALAYILGPNGPTGHKLWGIGADLEDVDVAAFIHGANVADLNNWKIGGLITTDDNKDAVLANILVAGAGQYLPGPQISCFVNEPKVSTFTLRQSMLIGDQVIRATRPMTNRVNRILVKYREPNSKYEIISGEEVTDAGYVAMDGGVRTTETTYPLIQQATQAHQIAAYELVNSREYEIDVTTTAEALGVERGDMITLDFPIGAIESQNFIVKNWAFDAIAQTVEMTLVSETPGKHDFALGRTATAPAPAALKSTAALNPAAPLATEWSLVANEITQTVTPPEPVEGEPTPEPIAPVTKPAFVFMGEATEPAISGIVVEIRPYVETRTGEQEDEDWTVAFQAAPGSTRIIVSEVAPTTTYDIALSYRSNLGVLSPRLIFGAQTSGDMSFDWNDPGVIINVPPVLRDLEGGKIKAEFIALEGEVTKTVQDAINEIDQANEEVRGRIEDAWDILGESDQEGLRQRIVTLEVAGTDGTIVARIEGLESREEGVNSRLLTVEQTQTTLTNGLATKAESSALTALSSVVNHPTSGLAATNSRLDTTNVEVGKRALTTSVTALAGEISTERGRINGAISRLDSVDLEIDGLATVQSVNALSTSLNTEKGRIDAANTRIDQVKITADGAATNSSVQQLTQTVNGQTSSISAAMSLATTADNRSKATIGLTTNVNGYVSGFINNNNGQTSDFNVLADKFNVVSPGNPADRIEFSGVSGMKMFKGGVRRIMIGFA
jgi:hypothetical protein